MGRAAAMLRSPRMSLALGLLLLAACLVLLNVIAARRPLRGDWTRGRVHALSPRTIATLRELPRPVTATLLMVPPERDAESTYPEVCEVLERSRRHTRLLRVERVDVDADPARAEVLARRFGIRPPDLRLGVVVLASGSRVKHVRVPALARYAEGRLVALSVEATLLAALRAVLRDDPPVVCFTSGHGEAALDAFDEGGYALFADEVRREGYRVRGLAPDGLASDVSGCALIVVGGPTRPFAQLELDALDRAAQRGAALLLLLGPILDRRVTRYGRTGLEDFVARWGIELPSNVVVDPHALPGEQRFLTWGTRDGYGAHPVARSVAGELTIWRLAREVRLAAKPPHGAHATALVRSSASGWGETDLASLRGEQPLRFDAAADARGPATVAAAAWSQRTRLVVLGSERGVLNRHIEDDRAGRALVLAALGWLLGEEAAAGPPARRPEHLRLRLDDAQLSRVFLLCVVALPAVALCLGLIVWRRRRR